MTKDFIIQHLERLSAEQIYQAIKDKVVEFNELKKTGKFRAPIQKTVNTLLKKDEEGDILENDIWNKAQEHNTIRSYKEYLARYAPSGRYVTQANARIRQITEEQVRKKEQLIQGIKENEYDYNAGKISNMLENGEITEADLIDNNIITKEALRLFLNPPKTLFSTVNNWSDLPPLKKKRTDIYLFGIVSSGKSCLLAGLLHYANSMGRIRLEVDNIKGTKYANTLIQAVGIGYVPPSTPVEGVNYIGAKLYGEEEKEHPINIIEMSGEFFDKTYEDASTSGEKSIGANNYLKNDNSKIIILVIDYAKNISSREDAIISNEAGKLKTVLSLLKANGTLDKATGVFLVLTKSDLLPNGSLDYAATDAFITKKYNGLRNDLRRFSEECEFKTKIHPFSLGRFMLEKTFTNNPACSKNIFEEILLASIINPKSRKYNKRKDSTKPKKKGRWPWNR